MLFRNPRRALLSEAATADLLNPEVSDEVKDVIADLEEDLTNNIEEVKEEDKTSNGGIPTTTDSVGVMEATNMYGNARYLVTIESVIAIMETEAEEAAKEAKEEEVAAGTAEPGEAPTEEEVAACEPSPVNVVEDIAQKNGVEPEQVAVVISAESCRFLAETAILECKAGKKKKDAAKKLKRIKEAKDQLEGKVKLVKA